MHNYAVARLRVLIDNYMTSRRSPAIVSTKAAARALTAYMSACPLEGRALENAIAESAVRHGHAVAFDLTVPPNGFLPLPTGWPRKVQVLVSHHLRDTNRPHVDVGVFATPQRAT
jgi:hypothetical protein